MKNKKIILWIALIVTALIPIYAQQYDSEKDFKVDWDKNVKDGVIITKYIGSKKEVRIPPSISNFTVTKIGKEAFMDRRYVTRVTIPNSIASIDEWAFFDCENLTSITIPNSVTSIGERAFAGCTSLASVTIPNSVTSIEWGTFHSCTSLTSVIIPDSVTNIEPMAFFNCTSLTAINVNAGNSAYSSQNGVLYNKDKSELIIYPTGKKGSFTIPDSVTTVGERAYFCLFSLTSITIPNSVTSIGKKAFERCTSLTSVTIPNSVTSIGEDAFFGCTNLINVTFQGTITSSGFGKNAFEDYSGSNLFEIYFSKDGGPGTYRRLVGGSTWRKQ